MDEYMKEILERIDSRLERIENKLDLVTTRSVKNETSITWIKTVGGFFATCLLSITGWIIYKLN